MPQSRKIATCSYCGSRTVLVMDGARHELACRACGAPLGALKAMPRAHQSPPKRRRGAGGGKKRRVTPPRPDRGRRRKLPLRKRAWPRILSELWEELEDFVD